MSRSSARSYLCVDAIPRMSGNIEAPEITIVMKGILVQRRKLSTYIYLKSVDLRTKVKPHKPKRKIFPPPAGETATAWADLGPGQVGETNLRHSSFSGVYLNTSL